MELITLVQRAALGDATAFDHLVTQHWRFVYTICLSQVGHAAQAEDLTQEVFLRVSRDLAAIRDPDKFLPWLRQVARNVCRCGLEAIQTGVLVFIYPLYLVQRGGIGPEIVGLLIGLNVLGRLLGLWVGGHASDRWGRVPVLVPGLLIYGSLLGTLSLLTHPLWLGLWSLAMGAAAGLVAGLPTALIGDHVPGPLQGVAVGWLRTMTDTGQILGPLVMGALADAVHLVAPFLLAGALLSVIAWWCYLQARAPRAAPSPS